MEVSNHITHCSKCGKEFTTTNKRKIYCTKRCKQRNTYSYQQKRASNRKKEIIKRFGGKCSKCGYSKNYSCLSFHHLDPKIKDFQLDSRSLSNRSMKVIEAELAKCSLLCLNCHSELHNPQCEL